MKITFNCISRKLARQSKACIKSVKTKDQQCNIQQHGHTHIMCLHLYINILFIALIKTSPQKHKISDIQIYLYLV